jgi:lysozyme family protein
MTPRDAVIRSLLTFEGGESDDPADHGGFTRYGLTLAEYLRLYPNKAVADFRALSREEVIDIITEEWALRPGYFRIADMWVLWGVIDFSINSGPRTATKALQRAAGLTGSAVDGVFGRETEMAASHVDPERLFRRLMAERVRHFGLCVKRDPTQAKFINGWLARAATILEAA